MEVDNTFIQSTLDSAKIEQIISHYKDEIEKHIAFSLTQFGKTTPLKEACEYALSCGKRFRPTIVVMIAKALGHNLNVWDAALAVEFFHTASLIADDLPCMDNDDERRNRPSLHKAFGESTALLASYALIAAGYRSIYQNAEQLGLSGHSHASESGKICMLALDNAAENTGILGATGGQFLDLFPPDQSLETLWEILNKKTVTLFEIAFVFGWLFGGGDLNKLDKVKQAAYHWGMAFQIADDISDSFQDSQQERQINLANALGLKQTIKIFNQQIELLITLLKELHLYSEEFCGIIAALNANFKDVH